MAWAPDYVTAADLKAYLEISDTADDALLGVWATSSSRAVDHWANRQFGQAAAPIARTYRGTPFYNWRSGMWELPIDDWQDLTGLTINGVPLASSGAVMLPDNAPLEGRPYTRIGMLSPPAPVSPGVTVTTVLYGLPGWSAVPTAVTAACRLQAARWNFRRNSPQGVAGSPDQGSEVRLLAKLDPDVAVVLGGYSRARRPG